MSQNFLTKCPACGEYIEVPTELENQAVVCPLCGREVLAESQPSSPVTPPPVIRARPAPKMQPGSNLIACKDCGNLVSKNAPTCPTCGAAIKRATTVSAGTGCLVIFLVFFLIVCFYGGCQEISRPPTQASPNAPAAVSFTVECKITVSDELLIVSNTGKTAWPSIEIYVNGDPLSGYGCVLGEMKPLDSKAVSLHEFTKSNGDRFNPFEKKVTEVWIGGGARKYDFEKYNIR